MNAKYLPTTELAHIRGYDEYTKLELVAMYIEDLIENGDIYIEGFEVWDEWFACAIGAKFSDTLE